MWKLLVLAVAAFGIFSGPSFAQDSADQMLGVARKKAALIKSVSAEERAQLEAQVMELLTQIPQRFPDDEPAIAASHHEIGLLERLRGDGAKAREAFERAAQMTGVPKVACEALHDLASLHAKEKRPKEAIAALERVVSEFRDQGRPRSEALIRLAGLYERGGELGSAEAALRRCLDEHEDQATQAVDAIDRLAQLKLKNGYREEAVQIVETKSTALRNRFAGTSTLPRVEAALGKMKIHAKLARGKTE